MVATTTQLADMARNVAPSAQVTTLLKANTDPHEYEVRPRDVKALAKADVVLRSGGETDEWLDGALDSAGVDDDAVVDAGRAAGIEGDDPHWWQDPRRAERAVESIGRAIPGADAGAVRGAAARAGCGGARAASTRCRQSERRLVTSHDALGYFARRYGIDVVGTVIPALSTVGAAVGRRRHAARGHDPRRGREDDLRRELREPEGRAGDRARGRRARRPAAVGRLARRRAARYIGSIADNTRALVEGFTGRPAECDARCLTSARPTSSAAWSRCCCSR